MRQAKKRKKCLPREEAVNRGGEEEDKAYRGRGVGVVGNRSLSRSPIVIVLRLANASIHLPIASKQGTIPKLKTFISECIAAHNLINSNETALEDIREEWHGGVC